jgi:Lon protease-like protein
VTSARVIPLFPLGSVLVPGLVLPLHIFEPRYRQLISDLEGADDDERGFGVIAIREGREVGADGVQALYDVGTFASLREVTALPDGRFDIVTVGAPRFRILELVDGQPYAQARVEFLDEDPGDASGPLAQSVAARFQEYRDLLTDEEDDAELPDDPRVLSYLVGAAVVADLGMRQRFLEAPDDSERLREELAFLRREIALIQHVPSLPAVDLAREPFSIC